MDMGDAFGALWKARDFPTYWAPWVGKYWLPALIALALVPMLWFRFVDRSHHVTYLARQEHTARLQNLTNEGFRTVGTMASDPSAAVRTETVEIRVRDSTQYPDGAIVQDVALVYSDSVSRFSYAVLAGQSVWQVGSTTTVEGGEQGIAITDALRRDYVENLVKESDKIVCVGLASSEQARPSENTRIADDRSINLCRALHNIGYADQTRQQTYGLSIGEPTETNDGISVTLQRSVIVVGVINSRRLPRPADVIQALTQLVQLPGVRMDQYERETSPRRKVFSGITRGPLNGLASGNWQEREADGSNPFDR